MVISLKVVIFKCGCYLVFEINLFVWLYEKRIVNYMLIIFGECGWGCFLVC